MMPGINPRQMQQAMKRMGIQQVEIDAKEVIIRTEDKELVFTNPQVSKVNMMGQNTYQIVGEPEERELSTTPDISEEDIQTVMEQAGVDKKKALAAIEKHNGDLAEAIMELKK
jgi:nascent polypeptide-associated complex subunit alpha